MPFLSTKDSHEEKSLYLRELFSRTYIKDILERPAAEVDFPVHQHMEPEGASLRLVAVGGQEVKGLGLVQKRVHFFCIWHDDSSLAFENAADIFTRRRTDCQEILGAERDAKKSTEAMQISGLRESDGREILRGT